MMVLIIILHGDIVHHFIRHGRFDGFFRSFHLDNGRSSVATTTATSRRLFGGLEASLLSLLSSDLALFGLPAERGSPRLRAVWTYDL